MGVASIYSEGQGLIFFLFLHENIIYCGYSLEVPQWGTSDEYPQHMFSWRNKKNIYLIHPLTCSFHCIAAYMSVQRIIYYVPRVWVHIHAVWSGQSVRWHILQYPLILKEGNEGPVHLHKCAGWSGPVFSAIHIRALFLHCASIIMIYIFFSQLQIRWNDKIEDITSSYFYTQSVY